MRADGNVEAPYAALADGGTPADARTTSEQDTVKIAKKHSCG